MSDTVEKKRDYGLLRVIYTGVCLSIAFFLPLVTGGIPQIGKLFSPIHLPVFLCGLLCGWPYGLFVGLTAPLLRSFLFGMPVFFPNAVSMAAELAVYGSLSAVLYRVFPKKFPFLYPNLAVSMIAGRLVLSLVKFTVSGFQHTEFSLFAYFIGTFTESVPGILLNLLLIPPIFFTLKKARLIPADERTYPHA